MLFYFFLRIFDDRISYKRLLPASAVSAAISLVSSVLLLMIAGIPLILAEFMPIFIKGETVTLLIILAIVVTGLLMLFSLGVVIHLFIKGFSIAFNTRKRNVVVVTFIMVVLIFALDYVIGAILS